MRVQFKQGKQKEFLKTVLEKMNCPSLRALRERGFNVSYNTLKSYFSENRTLPEELFRNLCYAAKLNPEEFQIELLKENWGQIKGGKK